MQGQGGATCNTCGKSGHFSKVCLSNKRSQGKPSQFQKEAAASDNLDNCALFIGNKNIWYPGVLIEKKAKFEV